MRNGLIEFLESFDYSEIDRETLISTFDALMSDGECAAQVKGCYDEYKATQSFDYSAYCKLFPAFAERLGLNEMTVRLALLLTLAPLSRAVFDREGIADAWRDSMMDFRWKNNECHRIYGVCGAFTDWFGLFYFGKRAAFGRLQFELCPAGVDYEANGFSLKADTPVINVHIPGDTRTPLSKEACDLAYARAAEHFGGDMGEQIVFRCNSWMLNPDHYRILPDGSNIRRFMSEYLPVNTVETDCHLWRIFNIMDYKGDPSVLSEDTSLMRAYKKYMMDGNRMKSTLGFRLHRA